MCLAGEREAPLQNLIVRGRRQTKLIALRMVQDFDEGPIYRKEDLDDDVMKHLRLTTIREEKPMLKYWDIIHWSATGFLTRHDNYASRIYYDKLAPNLVRDLKYCVRGLVGGIVRFLQGFVFSVRKRPSARRTSQRPYVLLITVGTAKYVSEEQEIIDACGKRRVKVLVLHTHSRKSISMDGRQLAMGSMLAPADHIRALLCWLWEVLRGFRWCFRHDRKSRSLFAVSINNIRGHCIAVGLSRRILTDYGIPLWALSLCPSSSMSIAIVGHMKKQGIVTAAIRTQATSYALEHIVTNTDILFCKNPHERQAYERVFAWGGPRLEDGCLLSLPSAYELEPLPLPDEYVLLLGTGASIGPDYSSHARYNKKLFQIAAAAGLPSVFKSHNLGKDLDEAWFDGDGVDKGGCPRVVDIRRNRELIDRASLVVTAGSTLVYYAILREIPVIVIEAEYNNTRFADEFQTAPILRIGWDQEVAMDRLSWSDLKASARAARRWFEKTYFLEKGSDYLIEFLSRRDG